MKNPLVVLLLCLVLPVAAAADSLKARFAGLDSFSAEFTQRLYDADQQLLEESHGLLRVQRPDRFNLEYREPYYQLYVADGRFLYFYDKDLEQVTMRPQQDALDNSPALVLSNPARLDTIYRIRGPVTEDDGLDWYELRPRQPGGTFERIQLAFKGKTLRIMELQDSFGQTTRLEFRNFVRNPDLAPRLFRFTPPKGVDVIRQ
ncbi:MAG: outer membrane lipoprotein chaperone LolA [Alphaproteobacteria bacterium]